LYINHIINIKETAIPNIIIRIRVNKERLVEANELSMASGNTLITRPVDQMTQISSNMTTIEIRIDLLFSNPPGKLNIPIKVTIRNITKKILP
jgi:hypothetical protein